LTEKLIETEKEMNFKTEISLVCYYIMVNKYIMYLQFLQLYSVSSFKIISLPNISQR